MPEPGSVVLQTEEVPDAIIENVEEIQPALTRSTLFLIGFGAVLVLGWYVVEPSVSRVVRRRNRKNQTITEAISRYTRLLTVVVALFAGIGAAGYGSILAGSALVVAAATLAVGVAGQTVIGSIVSGLALVVDPEFNVGDYIEWSSGEGEVTSITLRVTRVRRTDGSPVTVPNTELTSGPICRPYSGGRYRITETAGVAYEDDTDEALRLFEEGAERTDGISETPAPVAYVDGFGDDAVSIRVHYHVDDPQDKDLFGIRSEYARNAGSLLEESGVTVSPDTKRELNGSIEVKGEEAA